MHLAAMKKIIKYIRRWHYRRLYSRLFRHYSQKFDYADDAASQATKAFFWLTGEDYKYH